MKPRAQRASEAAKRAWRARRRRAEACGHGLTTRRQPVSIADEVAEIRRRQGVPHDAGPVSQG
jgi:hypothetical protein